MGTNVKKYGGAHAISGAGSVSSLRGGDERRKLVSVNLATTNGKRSVSQLPLLIVLFHTALLDSDNCFNSCVCIASLCICVRVCFIP